MDYDKFREYFEQQTGLSRDEIIDMIENKDWDEWPLVVKRLFVAVAMAVEEVIWLEKGKQCVYGKLKGDDESGGRDN